MNRLTIVIPVMNGLENLKTLLPSLRAQTFKDFEVIVSDNGSTDGTADWLKKNGIRVIENGVNLGFSKGCNVGLKAAKTQYAGILNDDTRLEQDTLELLVKALDERPEAGAIQPTILYWDGSRIQNRGVVMTHGSFIGNRDLDKTFTREQGGPEEIPMASGCCCIYRRDVLQQIGFFDESFDIAYYEDADISMNIKKAGFTLLCHPGALIYHKGGATAKRMAARVQLSYHRNRYKFLRKHAGKRTRIMFFLTFPIVTAYYLFVKRDHGYFRATYEALMHKL